MKLNATAYGSGHDLRVKIGSRNYLWSGSPADRNMILQHHKGWQINGNLNVYPEVNPDRLEAVPAGALPTTIHDARLMGKETLVRHGVELGRQGLAVIDNSQLGRGVKVGDGYVGGSTLLDQVVVEREAYLRPGTLLEEYVGIGHAVGLKMTIALMGAVWGSLINDCDSFLAGGTDRKLDHSEVGSGYIHFNFDQRGDKWGAMAGNVPRGVFYRSPRIFLGGHVQLVGARRVDYGSMIVAGSPVRKDVPADVMYSEPALGAWNKPFDPERYGAVFPEVITTAEIIGNLWALHCWYQQIRLNTVDANDLQYKLYQAAIAQIKANIEERVARLGKLVLKLPRSIEILGREVEGASQNDKRHIHLAEQKVLVDRWASYRVGLLTNPLTPEFLEAYGEMGEFVFGSEPRLVLQDDFVGFVKGLPDEAVSRGIDYLQAMVDRKTALFN